MIIKKYLWLLVSILCILPNIACKSTDIKSKVREKKIDCDADLPIDKLHKCIEKKADKYAPSLSNSNIHYSKKISLEDDIPSKKSSFKSIKKCYEKDNCIKQIGSVPYRYDDFDENLNLSLYTNRYHPNQLQIFAPPSPICAGKPNCHMPELFRTSYARYEYVEFGVGTKDFIIAKENKKENIYAVALHAVALNEKYLVITNVFHISMLNVEEILKFKNFTYPYKIERFRRNAGKEIWEDITVAELKDMLAHDGFTPTIRDKRKSLPNNNEQKNEFFLLDNNYTLINSWRFYEIKDSKNIKEVAISLDKRENPSKIYIKQDSDVYEIDIKH